jgi:hypothetical protein
MPRSQGGVALQLRALPQLEPRHALGQWVATFHANAGRRQISESEMTARVAFAVAPIVSDRLDHALPAQCHIPRALSILYLFKSRVIAAYPVEILRTFQIEDFVVTEFHPGQYTAKNLVGIAAHRVRRLTSGIVDECGTRRR